MYQLGRDLRFTSSAYVRFPPNADIARDHARIAASAGHMISQMGGASFAKQKSGRFFAARQYRIRPRRSVTPKKFGSARAPAMLG
jgi:hypothetical protein